MILTEEQWRRVKAEVPKGSPLREIAQLMIDDAMTFGVADSHDVDEPSDDDALCDIAKSLMLEVPK